MTQAERLEALNQRKAEKEAKINHRDEIQADWVRCISPVVNDDDPATFKRVLQAMDVTENRIRQENGLMVKLLDAGKKTLALILWCQQRDPQNELVRYLTGLVPHNFDKETGETTEVYDPDLAKTDNSMQLHVLQLLVKFGKTLTKREAAAKHSELAKAQAKKQEKWL